MSSSETFAQFYRLNSGTYDVYNSYGAFNSTFSDTADGNNDDTTAVGDSVYHIGLSHLPLIGTAPNGVILEHNGDIFLFSNSNYTNGQSIAVDTSSAYTYCFLEGTSIKTPKGERPVESIKIGDKVLSDDGRELTVRWMGHEAVRNGIGASVHKAPVKISAGAFGNGLPDRDLYVSNAHAFLLDDHLVVASALINGETITSVPYSELPSEFTYWHIETDEHELVVANGVAAETLSGAPERKDFDNYDSYIAAFGADRIIQPMSYPRIKDVAQMPQSLIERFNLQQAELDWESLLSGASVVLKQAN